MGLNFRPRYRLSYQAAKPMKKEKRAFRKARQRPGGLGVSERERHENANSGRGGNAGAA